MYFWMRSIDNAVKQYFEGDDGTGGSGGTGGDGDKNAGAKFIEKTDPVTGNKVKIPAELDNVIGHFISTTRSETEKKYKPLVEQLQNEKTDVDALKAEMEKLRQANMSAEEIARENAKKVIQEHEKTAKMATEEAKTWKERFEKTMIKNDIFASFAGIELCNAKQTAILFENEGRAKISEKVDADGRPTGDFETRMIVELVDAKNNPMVVEGTPEELFKRWIALDRNSHHRKNQLPVGGGSRTTGGQANIKSLETERMAGMSPTERLNAARGISENKR